MDRKSVGAYYTPPELAAWMCRWAIRRRSETVLDPACGEGVFLLEASRKTERLTGIDIDATACDRARRRVDANIICGDLFETTLPNHDVVVGNPPFVRFQLYRPAVARAFGLSPLASSWAPFVLRAAQLTRQRLAMLVPREALFANYAQQVLARLRESFSNVELIALDDYLFPGTLAKVAVLLCDRSGARGFAVREAANLDALDRRADAVDDWIWSRVPRPLRAAVREAVQRFPALDSVARVHTGVVTGDKNFFVLPSSRAHRLGFRYFTPAVTTPMHLHGAVFDADDYAALEPEPLCMFAYQDSRVPAALLEYLREGERLGVPLGYKCRNRTPWWKLRIGRAPDAFLGYLVMSTPKIVLNAARVRCTNNIHAVDLKRPVETSAWYNYASIVSMELVGRVCADGALKIEPGDASRIHVPVIPPNARLRRRIDAALRSGNTAEAFTLASEAARLPCTLVRDLRVAYERLRDARCIRSRRLSA